MFDHEALLFGSDDEFVATTAPFLNEGAQRGEAMVLAVGADLSRRVLDAVHDPGAVDVVDGGYDSPLETLRLNHELFAAAIEPMRIVGQIPASGLQDDWCDWARYEAAANDFFAPFDVSAICAYDTRTTADGVLDDVILTHPGITTADGHRDNAHYIDPPAFLALQAESEVDPLERTVPRFVLHDPLPSDAQEAVASLGRIAGLDDDTGRELALATREIVTNADRYGAPPVKVSAWNRPGRVAVAVSDCGTGPDDPYVGLMPGRSHGATDGLGLHLAYQVCDVTLTYSASAFTVHLASGGGPA